MATAPPAHPLGQDGRVATVPPAHPLGQDGAGYSAACAFITTRQSTATVRADQAVTHPAWRGIAALPRPTRPSSAKTTLQRKAIRVAHGRRALPVDRKVGGRRGPLSAGPSSRRRTWRPRHCHPGPTTQTYYHCTPGGSAYKTTPGSPMQGVGRSDSASIPPAHTLTQPGGGEELEAFFHLQQDSSRSKLVLL
jgi:hypothetical protein